ncbi:FUSC family protein [Sphingobacterium faecium]|uniref:FUSC family protein n=1 Tax=Sphingobacterium faecium TaxID=34087 RepID=UPI002468F2FA|nr:FUSC family membrane protein [Sphingobacterium faecium]MDH5826281.1 FUSC family membrane protein [Sphingobacterium faecium]
MIRSFIKKSTHLLKEFGPDALKACLSAMIPAFFIGYYYQIEYAVPFLIAAMNASMTDSPGRWKDKIQIGIWGLLTSTFTALSIGFLLKTPILLICAVSIFAGLFTFFAALGKRIAMIGVTNLFMITFTMGLHPDNIIEFCLFVGAGTTFYHAVTVIHYIINPDRDLVNVMNSCFLNTAKLIRVKANCYTDNYPLDLIFKETTRLNIVIEEQQDIIRYLLMTDRYHSNYESKSKFWTKTYQLMNLHALITAVDIDYTELRTLLKDKKALHPINHIMLEIAQCVENCASESKKRSAAISLSIDKIKIELASLKYLTKESNVKFIIANFLINSELILKIIQHLQSQNKAILISKILSKKIMEIDFTYAKQTSIKDLWSHIRRRSPIFLFSIRMSFLFLAGGVIGYILSDMKYSYWIFMTIIVVTRPSFSITLKRNIDRTAGTFFGIICAYTILLIVKDPFISITLSAFFMFCFLLFNKQFYFVSVVFITSSILVAFHILDPNLVSLTLNRLLFTFIGCFLSIISWYILCDRMNSKMDILSSQVIKKNNDYLNAVLELVQSPSQTNHLQMIVSRKRAFNTLSKWSDACFILQKEPGVSHERSDEIMKKHKLYYYYNSTISNLLMQRHNKNRIEIHVGTASDIRNIINGK